MNVILLATLVTGLGAQAECTDKFEHDLERNRDSMPAKALMYGFATIVAFPVGLSASSVELANQSAVVEQSKAFRVIKEAYTGAGAVLEEFILDLERKVGQEVDQAKVIDILIDADQGELCQGQGGSFPTKQFNFMTYSRLVEFTLAKL